MSNSYVVDKHGNKVYTCSYSWTDPDGHIERCRAPKACSVCGQCSRLDGERELGHCTGHLGLNEHIEGIPGRDGNKIRDNVAKVQSQIREQHKGGRNHKRKGKGPVVERRPNLKKQ